MSLPLACPVCGTPPVPGARFCFACGTPLEIADAASAERRVVTVLFGDLTDFTSWAEQLDPERVGSVTSRVLATLANEVNEYGGHVDKLTGDGIMAVFGAPTAHEDDPERAVRAAWAMQLAVRRLVTEEAGGGRRLGLRVGLNTGEVLAGVQAGLSYTVVGDTVNTAARLSDAASVGAVIAGRETAAVTMHMASWRSLDPLRLKGKRDPVPAFELVGLRGGGAPRIGSGVEVPLVGRDAELGLLRGRLLEVADSGKPQSVVVTGEAGAGKTRLAVELARAAGDVEGARVLWGRCAPYGEGRELAPLADWVRTACGIDETATTEQAAEAVLRTVRRLDHPAYSGPTPIGLSDALFDLLGLVDRPSVTPREAAAPGTAAAASAAVGAVAQLVGALAADGPVLLVADDLQWGSEQTRAAVAAVGSRASGPCLLLLLGRSELLMSDEWWRMAPEPVLLPLVPLERSASERLLRIYLGGDELDPVARDAILDRAAGNPFFLGELLQLLIDRALLQRVDGSWQLREELPEEVLPAGVQAVLAARIDDLPRPSRAVLRDAAVVGTRFPSEAVLALGGDEATVRGALDDLVDRGILRITRDGTYAFLHALTRDVAYSVVPKSDRARRHAAVARWAAEKSGASLALADSMVAAHGERALALAAEMRLPSDDVVWRARAVTAEALLRLGEAALARDDNVAAADLFTRTLAAAAGHVPAAYVGRAAARVAQHALAEARLDLDRVLSSDDPRIRGAALAVLGDLLRKSGDDPGAVEALVSALALASEQGDDRVVGEVLRQLGLIEYYAGRMQAAEERFTSALDLAERVGDTRGAGWALQHLAWSATTRGDYRLAEQRLRAAAELFGSLDDSGGMSWTAGTEAFVRLLQGRLTAARELAQGLLPLGEALGDRWGVAACLTIDSHAAAELGDVSLARAEAERACTAFAELGDAWGQGLALVSAGVAARDAGEPKEAVQHLEQAVQVAEQAGYTVVVSLALVALGYANLELGDLVAAEAAAYRAAAVLAGLHLEPHAAVGAQVLLAQVLRARGDVDTALELLDAAESVQEPSLLFPLRQALAHRAGALLEAGRAEEALACAERAAAVDAEDIRSQVVALRVLGAARAACGDPAGAREALESALAVASSTEHVTEVAATERALAAL
jgi:class 3 adenylate cyclase/tetratricopeptide (TPR) repeat protein